MLAGVGLWSKMTVRTMWDCSGGPAVKNLPCKAGDMGSVSGWGTKIPQLASIRQMSRQVSRGSAGDYEADEQAGVAKIGRAHV